MKVPAVAIAAAFTGGIALGLWPPLARHSASQVFLIASLALAGLLIVCACLLLANNHVPGAVAASTLSWMTLGIASALVSQQPLPDNHVIRLIENARIELHGPLKWHGTLRDEPQRLPWGYGWEVQLSGVEYDGALLPVQGGLRLSYSPHQGDPSLPNVHAGDEVVVLAQAKRPRAFLDEGAFDRRAYLASQGIDLVATLRAPELLERISSAPSTARGFLARARRNLRDELDALFSTHPQVAGVLRAMLLGDRSFIEREESLDFQKTGVFHVLVVAGLHVGAFAVFLFWIARKLRLAAGWTVSLSLVLLLAYVAVVEQRPPVLRAALMAGIVLAGRLLYRRLDLLNSAGLAALVLLIAQPLAVRDSSFQLTFVAIGCIAGLAVPWLERTVQPYARALQGWRDVTRDAAHRPLAAQFRIDLRIVARWISARVPHRLGALTEAGLVGGLRWSFRVWELLAVTLVLQVGMLPLMASDFHRITLAAPLANLAAVPLTGLIVPLGFLTLVSKAVFPVLGKALALPLGWATLLLLRIVEWFAHLPRSSYRIPGPPVLLVAAFFVLAALLCAMLRLALNWQRRAVLSLCMGLTACAVLIAASPFAPQWASGKLELTVLDVGQGDSLFVVSPNGKTLLIDGGGAFGGFGGQRISGVDPGEEAVSPYLWSRGFQRIDVVALTHAHQDHLGGLSAILENFRVGELWIGREVPTPAMTRLEEFARARHTLVQHQRRGTSFEWDSVQGQFLWPEVTAEDAGAEPKNDDSLVLRLRYGSRTFLLPGDVERPAEQQLLTENQRLSLRTDVLKVAHHGGRNSTTADFLQATQPRVAVISAGADNAYGHPSRELLQRLEESQVQILRTDRDGAVHVLTDGHDLEISCYVPCRNLVVGERQAQLPLKKKNSEQQ